MKDNVKPSGSGDWQVEFAPDSVNLFNFSLNGWVGNFPESAEQQNQRFSANQTLIEAYSQSIKTDAPTYGRDFNLDYTRKFKKPGEKLYLMAQHNRSKDDLRSDAFQLRTDHIMAYRELNDDSNRNHEWTFQADYILPLGHSSKYALESVAKAILRDNSSDYKVEASNSADPEALLAITDRSDLFNYKQNGLAAYSQVKFKWNNGWALHAGARMEGTFLQGNQRQAASGFANNFWNFLPRATIFKKQNANHDLTLSYTKRICRPSILDLNPNINSQDPKNILTGNPALRPEEVNQVEFYLRLAAESDLFVNFSLFDRVKPAIPWKTLYASIAQP